METVRRLLIAANAAIAAMPVRVDGAPTAQQLARQALVDAVVNATGPDAWADDHERDSARTIYSSDEIEIDDRPMISRGDGGVWVAAWVWLYEDNDSNEIES